MSQESRFCHKCGAPLQLASAFCAKCGTPVLGAVAPSGPTTAPPATPSAPPTWEGRHERHEKHEKNEKREKQEKQEKHEKQEKGRGGDLAGAITGGLVLILLGTLFYLAQTNVISVTWNNWWMYFMIGMGAILIFTGLVRYAQRRYMPTGSFIGGAVLIFFGLAFVSNTSSLWSLILVVLGVVAIASAFRGRRRNPAP